MSDATLALPAAARSRRAFLLRKLHSLTGVVPVGAYLVFHLWENAAALRGEDAYTEMVGGIQRLPYLPLLEAAILLPLLFHALYGIKLALEGRHNAASYGFFANWMYTLQRVTGLVAFAFILYHLWEFRWQKLVHGMTYEQFYPVLCAHMTSTVRGIPVTAIAYVVGIAACVFHFANGMWGFCWSWGITTSRRAQRLAAATFGVVGVAVFVLGANTTVYFATGSRLYLRLGAGEDHLAPRPRTCADLLLPRSHEAQDAF